jgi:hypothetical protein
MLLPYLDLSSSLNNEGEDVSRGLVDLMVTGVCVWVYVCVCVREGVGVGVRSCEWMEVCGWVWALVWVWVWALVWVWVWVCVVASGWRWGVCRWVGMGA